MIIQKNRHREQKECGIHALILCPTGPVNQYANEIMAIQREEWQSKDHGK